MKVELAKDGYACKGGRYRWLNHQWQNVWVVNQGQGNDDTGIYSHFFAFMVATEVWSRKKSISMPVAMTEVVAEARKAVSVLD